MNYLLEHLKTVSKVKNDDESLRVLESLIIRPSSYTMLQQCTKEEINKLCLHTREWHISRQMQDRFEKTKTRLQQFE